jgi:hypothetical protein
MSNTFIFKPFLALGWWSEGYNAPGADFTRGLSAWEGYYASGSCERWGLKSVSKLKGYGHK